MRWPTLAHLVLGMDLEPADVRRGVENLAVMLRLQPDPGARRKRLSQASAGTRYHALGRGQVAVERLEAALAVAGKLDGEAGAFRHERPGIALIVDGRSACAARARPGVAAILALLGDAIALLLI